MTLRGHFDGKVVILDEPPPAALVPDTKVLVELESEQPADQQASHSNALLWLAERANEWDLNLPPDFSEQHDHYIHGTPKR